MSQTPESERRLGNRRRPPVRRQVSPIWFAVALFALLLIVNLVQTTLRDGTTLSYSDFKAQLKQGRVTEVTSGNLKEGENVIVSAGGQNPNARGGQRPQFRIL